MLSGLAMLLRVRAPTSEEATLECPSVSAAAAAALWQDGTIFWRKRRKMSWDAPCIAAWMRMPLPQGELFCQNWSNMASGNSDLSRPAPGRRTLPDGVRTATAASTAEALCRQTLHQLHQTYSVERPSSVRQRLAFRSRWGMTPGRSAQTRRCHTAGATRLVRSLSRRQDTCGQIQLKWLEEVISAMGNRWGVGRFRHVHPHPDLFHWMRRSLGQVHYNSTPPSSAATF